MARNLQELCVEISKINRHRVTTTSATPKVKWDRTHDERREMMQRVEVPSGYAVEYELNGGSDKARYVVKNNKGKTVFPEQNVLAQRSTYRGISGRRLI